MAFELKKNELLIPFVDAAAFAKWLKTNHAKSTGLWLKLAKKGAGTKSITYAEALDEALCWGWIDGQKSTYDDAWWLQRFSPRGPRSIWSKVNREKVRGLIDAGRMQPPGQAAITRAKENGQWDQAYDSPKTIKEPEDLLAALRASPAAEKFYATLNSANRFSVLHRVHTAKKPETRARRIATFVEMFVRGEKPHS